MELKEPQVFVGRADKSQVMNVSASRQVHQNKMLSCCVQKRRIACLHQISDIRSTANNIVPLQFIFIANMYIF